MPQILTSLEEEQGEKASFYDELLAIDIIDPVLQLIIDRKVTVDIDEKIKVPSLISVNRYFTFSCLDPDRKCGKWLDIYHEHYKILPPPCKKCWKLVYKPYTVVELIEIQKFQSQLNLPAKCGLENRDYTSDRGSYRAFWYCPYDCGLQGGREHFQLVKTALEDHFGKEFIHNKIERDHFYLKRGCTELERDFGPSDQWDQIDHSKKFNILESVWEDPWNPTKEFPPLVYTNYKRWIEYAIAYGDQSVLQYIKGKELGIPAVKYQSSNHKAEDFKPKGNTV